MSPRSQRWKLQGMFLLALTPFLVGSTLAQTEPRAGQQQPLEKRLTINLKMTDANIARLKAQGRLKKMVPPSAHNRIDGIRMRREVSFIDKDFVADQHVEKWGDALVIFVNDQMLERLDYQPFLSKVYYSNFTSIVLSYDTTHGTLPSSPSAPRIHVRLDKKRGLKGQIAYPKTLNLTTDFGKVAVEFDRTQGIRFDGKRACVWLNNGDRITGTFEFDRITLKCAWGDQDLDVSEIETLAPNRFVDLPPVPPKTDEPKKWAPVVDSPEPLAPVEDRGKTILEPIEKDETPATDPEADKSSEPLIPANDPEQVEEKHPKSEGTEDSKEIEPADSQAEDVPSNESDPKTEDAEPEIEKSEPEEVATTSEEDSNDNADASEGQAETRDDAPTETDGANDAQPGEASADDEPTSTKEDASLEEQDSDDLFSEDVKKDDSVSSDGKDDTKSEPKNAEPKTPAIQSTEPKQAKSSTKSNEPNQN